jgi:hypothetical protein
MFFLSCKQEESSRETDTFSRSTLELGLIKLQNAMFQRDNKSEQNDELLTRDSEHAAARTRLARRWHELGRH